MSKYQPHEQRVIAERLDLASKLHKLKAFLASDASESVPTEEIELLNEQASCMYLYLNVLDCRIELFREDEDFSHLTDEELYDREKAEPGEFHTSEEVGEMLGAAPNISTCS